MTLPGGLELNGPLFLLQKSFISSSLDELSLPAANCCRSFCAFTWDHFLFSGAVLSLLLGLSIGQNPHSFLSSLASLCAQICFFEDISSGTGELIFNVSSSTLLLLKLGGLSMQVENENENALKWVLLRKSHFGLTSVFP